MGTYFKRICGGDMLFNSQLYAQLGVVRNKVSVSLQDGYLVHRGLWVLILLGFVVGTCYISQVKVVRAQNHGLAT